MQAVATQTWRTAAAKLACLPASSGVCAGDNICGSLHYLAPARKR